MNIEPHQTGEAAIILKLVGGYSICEIESALADEPTSLANRHTRSTIRLIVRDDAVIFFSAAVTQIFETRVMNLGFNEW
jgi:predicted RNA polymerase sigma factor